MYKVIYKFRQSPAIVYEVRSYELPDVYMLFDESVLIVHYHMDPSIVALSARQGKTVVTQADVDDTWYINLSSHND